MSVALDVVLLVSGCAHVLYIPYTKVEESFSLHAAHDILIHRSALPNYDHFTFPGAIQRSFIPSILLAALATPLIHAAHALGLVSSKFDLQIIIRLTLAAANAAGLALVRRAVARRFGRLAGLFFVLITCSQFHLPFWMGRTLPNMFALLPANLAIYLLTDLAPQATRPSPRSVSTALTLLTFATVVCRAELALLTACYSLQLLVQGHLTFVRLLKVGAVAGVLSLSVTVLVDSYLWKQWPLWPEFASMYFNVYEGKSADWGVSPFHTYFSAHLPKLLLSALPLAALGAALDRRARALLFVPSAFVALMSCLGHKEWRFVVYVVPVFNIAAARGARWMVSLKKTTFFGRLMFLVTFGLLAANALATALSLHAAKMNYPGGEALALMNARYAEQQNVHIHICDLAAQTGASLFLQTHAPPYPPYLAPPHAASWTYAKLPPALPNASAGPAAFAVAAGAFTHLIAESAPPGDAWKAVESVQGFARWRVGGGALKWGDLAGVLGVVAPVMEKKLWIYELKD